jgi:hypothetical protein
MTIINNHKKQEGNFFLLIMFIIAILAFFRQGNNLERPIDNKPINQEQINQSLTKVNDEAIATEFNRIIKGIKHDCH